MHKTKPIQVWVDVDIGVAELVEYLNTIPEVRTFASCQGTIEEGGKLLAYVMASWSPEMESRLHHEFDIEFLGENWGYIRKKDPLTTHIS